MRRAVAGCFMLCAALGCGRVSTAYPPDGAPDSAILELTMTMAGSALTWPQTVQAMALATYDDGTTRDVTSAAMWSSTDPTIAGVAAGLIDSRDAGSTTIQVELGDHRAVTPIAVSVPTLAVLSYDDNLVGNIAGIDFFVANATGDRPPVRSIRGAATTFEFRPYGMALHGQELFVSCGDSNFGISVFPVSGSGNIAPSRRTVGAKTEIVSTIAFSVTDQEMFSVGRNAANQSSILAFPTLGTGNIAPIRKIAGAATRLSQPLSAVVANGEIYVAEFFNQLIAVFPQTATGNVAPVRVIEGPNTRIGYPIAAQVFNDELYVVTSDDSIAVFATAASGNVAPNRLIKGPRTKLTAPNMVDVVGDLIFVANRDDQVLVFKTTDRGDVAPSRELSGPNTHLHNPVALTVF